MKSLQRVKPKILLIEDRLSLARCYSEFLAGSNYDFFHADTGAKGLEAIASEMPEVVLLDLQLPDMDGQQVLQKIKAENLPITVVVITAASIHDMESKLKTQGASFFLEKPITKNQLCFNVEKALERQKLLDSESKADNGFCGFMGSSLVMQAVYNTIKSSAASSASVFITGESGTGKEVCAQAIHQMSQRLNKQCVVLNCAAIPSNLMESEIFGHIKGAFTGAVANRVGAAEQANGGTLFLDEIGELDIDLQSKLLRFIQTGQFQAVGSNELKTVDVRFVCATNRNPLELVKNGTFREDLYYRLHVVPIQLPPLRDRGSDILHLAESFLTEFALEENKEFCTFSEEVRQYFLSYYWPGNVRQMLNVIRNIVVLNNAHEVQMSMLPSPLNDKNQIAMLPNTHQAADGGFVSLKSKADIKPLWRVEMDAIEEAIEICGGSIAKAADCLGVSPSTIYRKKPFWKRQEDQDNQKLA